jgi:hypothetical protein
MKQRIYIDTSVVGGYFDREFSADTVPFFQGVLRGEQIILVSSLLDEELKNAPDFVRGLLDNIPLEYIERVEVTQDANDLAMKYIEAGVVGRTSFDDCRHIATATLYKADVLVSWNFKHIVNLMRINGYNGINLQNGYKTLEIRTPKEIMNYGTEK